MEAANYVCHDLSACEMLYVQLRAQFSHRGPRVECMRYCTLCALCVVKVFR